MALRANKLRRSTASRRFDLETLKSIPIRSVAQDFGFKLNLRGGGRCLLPGHEDKNPSFSIRSSTNSFVCFACGQRGSAIDLVMQMQGLEFVDACRWLHDRYVSHGSSENIAPPKQKAASSTNQQIDKSVHQSDQHVYGWLVDSCPLRDSGREYLRSRNISDRTITKFGIGQMPNYQILGDAILKWGLPRLEKAGLVVEGRYGPRFVFPQEFILFPFYESGSVKYLQARAIAVTAKRRWICPQGILPSIYNADAILDASKTIWVCEGITDVLSADVLHHVAIGFLGAHAHMDERQAGLLAKKDVVIVADADRAGSQFRKRLTGKLAKRGATVISKALPTGVKDLNDYLALRATRP